MIAFNTFVFFIDIKLSSNAILGILNNKKYIYMNMNIKQLYTQTGLSIHIHSS